jgi:hypothetical protein
VGINHLEVGEPSSVMGKEKMKEQKEAGGDEH